MHSPKIVRLSSTLMIALASFSIVATSQVRERVLHVFTYSPSCDSPILLRENTIEYRSVPQNFCDGDPQ